MWLTVEEASKEMKVRPKHVRDLLNAGKLVGHKTQVGWIVDPKSTATYIPDIGGRPKKIKRKYTKKSPIWDSTKVSN